jgi:hypothetical protein
MFKGSFVILTEAEAKSDLVAGYDRVVVARVMISYF